MEQLITEWEPEPLVPPQKETRRIAEEEAPIIQGQ